MYTTVDILPSKAGWEACTTLLFPLPKAGWETYTLLFLPPKAGWEA